MFLRNFGSLSQGYTALYPRRRNSSIISMIADQIYYFPSDNVRQHEHFSPLVRDDRTPWAWNWFIARPLPTHDNTNTETRTYIHAPTRIQTHNRNVTATRGTEYLEPRGYYDGHVLC
jgi:hypothetical protein